jgi:serine/threonine protein kinase
MNLPQAGQVLDTEFSSLIKKMMAHDPSSRPTTQDLLDDTIWNHIEDNTLPKPRTKRVKTIHTVNDGSAAAGLPR